MKQFSFMEVFITKNGVAVWSDFLTISEKKSQEVYDNTIPHGAVLVIFVNTFMCWRYSAKNRSGFRHVFFPKHLFQRITNKQTNNIDLLEKGGGIQEY